MWYVALRPAREKKGIVRDAMNDTSMAHEEGRRRVSNAQA